jgi:hypothetical protein
MQDEHFMRSWNFSHRRLSTDIDRALGNLADHLPRRARRTKPIGNPYGLPNEVERRPALSPAAAASLRGFAATVITAALWVVVMALATPAPGLAASVDLVMEPCACLAYPPLA